MHISTTDFSDQVPQHQDQVLQTALGLSRQVYLDKLPQHLAPSEKEDQWRSYLISLSSSPTAISPTSNVHPTASEPPTRRAPPLSPTPPPDAKKRRLNYDAAPPPLSINTQSSQPFPSINAPRYDEGLSPFGRHGALAAPPIVRHHSEHSRFKQSQDSSQMVAASPMSARRGSAASQSQRISVQDYNPADFFRTPSQPIPTTFSSMNHNYQAPPNAPQSSPLQSTSSQSSYSGVSLEDSTVPTSAGMSRVDSTGCSSLPRHLGMLRVGSSTSPNTQQGLPMTPAIAPQQILDFSSSQGVSSQSVNPAHDISQMGAQFTAHDAIPSAPDMERRTSSNSRPLHPKQPTSSLMSRTPSSAAQETAPEIIRVPSNDGSGSVREAIRITPVTSKDQPPSPKVMCPYLGCTSQPGGFKGDHEMRRHFDRDHSVSRRVYICAPLEEDPNFLSKTACKACESKKRYNEDYNAGEHLRRMHFNPKKPKKRGNVLPEDRRGGKGGGKIPPMPILRQYMFTYFIATDAPQVADMTQITEPEKVNSESSVIIPSSAYMNQPAAKDTEALINASSSSAVPKLEPTQMSPTIRSIAVTNISPESIALYPNLAVEEPEVPDNWNLAVGNHSLEMPKFAAPPPFDPTSPTLDLNHDPILFDSTQPEMSDLSRFFSDFTASPM